MSGCCNYIATINFLLLIGMQISFVESRNYRKQKRFTRDDVCKETVKTIEDVGECPIKEELIRKRSNEMRCEDIHDVCTAEKLMYHCVRYKTKLIEVCAPRNYITGKCCVQFNEGVGRIVEDYSVSCSECPFHYFSNESLNYPTCLESVKSLSAAKSTMMTTVGTTSITTPTFESRPNNTSHFLTISPLSKKCRSATGRRKRYANCGQYITTTNDRHADYMRYNKTHGEKAGLTRSYISDAGLTVGIVTLSVFICVAVIVACFVWKGTSNKHVQASRIDLDTTHRDGLLEKQLSVKT